jgi:hypothetical protein
LIAGYGEHVPLVHLSLAQSLEWVHGCPTASLHEPVPSHVWVPVHSGGSSVSFAMARHCPTLPATSHDWQGASHVATQQTPSTHCPLAQSAPAEHPLPMPQRAGQLPPQSTSVSSPSRAPFAQSPVPVPVPAADSGWNRSKSCVQPTSAIAATRRAVGPCREANLAILDGRATLANWPARHRRTGSPVGAAATQASASKETCDAN